MRESKPIAVKKGGTGEGHVVEKLRGKKKEKKLMDTNISVTQ